MEKYTVTGMTCAACAARVENAVLGVQGVSSCAVSLLTNSMNVEGNASVSDVINAVQKAGYGARSENSESANVSAGTLSLEETQKMETSVLKKRLVCSIIFLVLLMYTSMGHNMAGFPLPFGLGDNLMAQGLVQLILSSIVLLINRKFFTGGFRSLVHRSPNMDTLVALGSGVSFAYSLALLFVLSYHPDYMAEFYFESAAMIVTLITVGKLLESVSKGRTTNALKSLMNLAPKTAVVLRDGVETVIPSEEIKAGDLFILKPGDSVPADGIVIEGSSSVDESALTGESIPVEKTEGSSVTSASVNINGWLKCKAEKVGKDTVLSQIIQIVSDSAATKAPVARIADKVSGIFVPFVIGIAVLTLAVWLICGASVPFALARGISVLVISCPCALGLATPVSIMVGSGKGASKGILFKTAAALEESGKMNVIALDKTGTITEGRPQVTDVICADGIKKEYLIHTARSLESKSSHPLAKAITEGFSEESDSLLDFEKWNEVSGNGIEAVFSGKKYHAGSQKYISTFADMGNLISEAQSFASMGKTPLFFEEDGKLLGIIAVSDVIRKDSAQAVQQLKNLGLKTVMITGDNKVTAEAIAFQAGVDQVIAGVLPEQKALAVEDLKKYGKVCMVGDGINDAPALVKADCGFAIGAGSDIALDSADVVLVKNSLLDAAAAIRLSRKTLVNIKENLFWAFFYNVISIPLAAGAYYHAFGWTLNPMVGAAAMSLSSFCVVSNSLRLNLVNINKESKKHKKYKEAVMAVTEKTIKVEGMMCSHCEAHVKEALEKIRGIDEAVASHEKKEVLLKMSKDVDDKKIAEAVEKAGYKVIE